MSDVFAQVGELTYVEPKEKIVPTEDPLARVEAKGTILPDDLPIFLTESILLEVITYSASDLSRELGGVFVGEVYRHLGRPWLRIEGYIKARHGVGTAGSFRFTHDTWSAITREREQKYQDRPVIGWHHTHPGYGIFLSSMDQFIQNRFFNLPWMVALVVDPREEHLGFFQWKKDRIVKCGFYYVR